MSITEDKVYEKYASVVIKRRAEEERIRFEKNMNALKSEQIFNKAYEIVCKEEIEDMIFAGCIDNIEGATDLIYSHCEGCILDTFYSVWMDMDYIGTPAQHFKSLVENVIKRIKKENGYGY